MCSADVKTKVPKYPDAFKSARNNLSFEKARPRSSILALNLEAHFLSDVTAASRRRSIRTYATLLFDGAAQAKFNTSRPWGIVTSAAVVAHRRRWPTAPPAPVACQPMSRRRLRPSFCCHAGRPAGFSALLAASLLLIVLALSRSLGALFNQCSLALPPSLPRFLASHAGQARTPLDCDIIAKEHLGIRLTPSSF